MEDAFQSPQFPRLSDDAERDECMRRIWRWECRARRMSLARSERGAWGGGREGEPPSRPRPDKPDFSFWGPY